MSFASNRRTARVSALALVALASASACIQEQDYLTVDRAVWYDDAEMCTLDASGDAVASNTIDVFYDNPVAMGFVVTNNQSPNANSNSGIDDSQIEVESVEVELSFSGGAVEGGSFEASVPNNALAGGDSVPFLVQIPASVVASIRAGMTSGQLEVLEMSVVFKGRKYGYSGGKKLGEVKTREFTFPFDVCLGCVGCATCGFWQTGVPCEDAGDTGSP